MGEPTVPRDIWNLATEIQYPAVDIPEISEPVAFRALWVKALAGHVVKLGAWDHRSAYPAKIAEWCGRIDAAAFDEIPATLRTIRNEISAIDSDDGWATDCAGSTLEQVCLALLPNTRWLAEAGAQVWTFATGSNCFNEVSHYSRKAWLRSVFGACLPPAAISSPAGR